MKIYRIAFLIALFPVTQVACAEPIVRIVVKDANAHGLAVELGELAYRNVVIAGYSENRLTINERYNDAAEIYLSIARQLGAEITYKNEITVIRPSCLKASTLEADAPLSLERASFNFNFTRAAALFQVLAIASNLPFQAQEPALRSPILGVRLREVSYRATHDIIAAVTGTELRRSGTTYVAVDTLGNMQCAEMPKIAQIPGAYREGGCPSKITPQAAKILRKVSCEPLEGYPLHDLIPRGFVDVANRRFVVLEASNHRTFFATKGNYLGHHLGKISSIDDNGFAVQELQQDSEGFYYYASTRIDYSNNRTNLPREYP